jgi:hypothetical protein
MCEEEVVAYFKDLDTGKRYKDIPVTGHGGP